MNRLFVAVSFASTIFFSPAYSQEEKTVKSDDFSYVTLSDHNVVIVDKIKKTIGICIMDTGRNKANCPPPTPVPYDFSPHDWLIVGEAPVARPQFSAIWIANSQTGEIRSCRVDKENDFVFQC